MRNWQIDILVAAQDEPSTASDAQLTVRTSRSASSNRRCSRRAAAAIERFSCTKVVDWATISRAGTLGRALVSHYETARPPRRNQG